MLLMKAPALLGTMVRAPSTDKCTVAHSSSAFCKAGQCMLVTAFSFQVEF
jgi:hypothetical protein